VHEYALHDVYNHAFHNIRNAPAKTDAFREMENWQEKIKGKGGEE
jgi:hypothetical protein